MAYIICDSEVVAANLHRITGQVFRLLPSREEGEDWTKPLDTLIIELTGMFSLLPDLSEGLSVISKLEGLRMQDSSMYPDPEAEFANYRRTIFECCTLLSKLEQKARNVVGD